MERRKSVLIVDDDRDTREAIREVLELFGHDARTAATGAEAIALFAERPADVAIIDLGLPDMTGHEVALHLRSLVGDGPLLLVAFTGGSRDGDARRSYAAGMDYHLRKPVPVDTLRDVLARAS